MFQIFRRRPNPQKAQRHEAKGDELLKRGRAEKALNSYRKALQANPDLPGIFDKLIAAKDGIGGEWKMEEFVESVDWAMRKQEQDNPAIRQVHAQLSPEWERASALAVQIMTSATPEAEREATEQLAGMGEVGTRALIDILLQIKKGATASADPHAPTVE